MTQYRVRETTINVHPLIRSIPPARKFIAEKTVRVFFIRMWRQIDGPLWYDTAEEAWAAVRRDAESWGR